MIQVYSRPVKNNDKPTKAAKAPRNNETDARDSNLFFQNKNQKFIQHSAHMANKRMDSAASMQGGGSSPLLKHKRGGPNINGSHDMRPSKRGRKLSSNFDSVESPESRSRQQSTAPLRASKGDISSIMNQYNQEDCQSLDSGKQAKLKIKNVNELTCSNRNAIESSKNGRKRVVSGVSTDYKMKEIGMGGLITS